MSADEMETSFFLRGIAFGFAIAAPVGPIGLLCIRRTLTEGRAIGLATGLGAASADALYGCVAGFGLTILSTFLIEQSLWLRLVGGGFLLYLGAKSFLAVPQENAATTSATGLFAAGGSTFLLTLSNPATILSFVAVFASQDIAASTDYSLAGLLVVGVFLGSALWWLILSSGVGLFRSRFDSRRLHWVNRLSGIVLIGFGIAALASCMATT